MFTNILLKVETLALWKGLYLMYTHKSPTVQGHGAALVLSAVRDCAASRNIITDARDQGFKIATKL